MKDYYLTIHMLSDTTFGRGEGLAGSVDTEIEHDAYGCPFISGRTLKGLLREEWQHIVYACQRMNGSTDPWETVGAFLFGKSGDTLQGSTPSMHIGSATLPPALLQRVHRDVDNKNYHAADVLASLTTIRRQTAVDATTDAPARGSLRSERALIRTTFLCSVLTFEREPENQNLGLLAACVLATRRGGLGRNRGRGRLQMRLHESDTADASDDTFTQQCFAHFVREVRP